MAKWRKKRRRWLNPLSSPDNGSVITEIAIDNSRWVDCEIHLSDCGRFIHLEMGFDSPKLQQARIKKIRTLIAALEDLIGDIEECEWDPTTKEKWSK